MKCCLLVLLLLAVPAIAHGQDVDAQVTRGITGSTTVRSVGQRIRPRSDLDLDSPILVRIAGERTLEDGVIEYEFEYIGSHAGTFDLREVLEGADGSVLNHESVPEITVEIVSHLSADSETDVFVVSNPGTELTGGYRIGLIVIGVLWGLVPVVAISRRMRSTPEVVVAEAPKPSLADQLKPLVVSASKRELSVSERGRLELLLYAYWAKRLGLNETDRPSAIASLRRNETAGLLLRAIEGWLHGRETAVVAPSEINSLLEPYRTVPALETGANA